MSTQININGVKTYTENIPDIKSVSFNYLGHKVYAAQKIEKMVGVFVSSIIQGEENLVRWNEVSWVATKVSGTDVFVYVRSSSSESGIDSAIWRGPYFNEVNDISDQQGKYLQFMVVLSNDGTKTHNYQYIDVAATPIFQSIDLTYLSPSTASKFYTSTFNLGFVPKHVLLTYNGNISEDAIVRFAISGFNSIDPNDYQYIDPNKIEELSGLSILSDKIKLMIEMIGDSSTLVTIHEFALMFSGDEQLMLNDMSSSSESSSSSSSSF